MKINIQEYKYLKDMNIFREYILNGLIPLFIFKQNSSKTDRLCTNSYCISVNISIYEIYTVRPSFVGDYGLQFWTESRPEPH